MPYQSRLPHSVKIHQQVNLPAALPARHRLPRRKLLPPNRARELRQPGDDVAEVSWEGGLVELCGAWRPGFDGGQQVRAECPAARLGGA